MGESDGQVEQTFSTKTCTMKRVINWSKDEGGIHLVMKQARDIVCEEHYVIHRTPTLRIECWVVLPVGENVTRRIPGNCARMLLEQLLDKVTAPWYEPCCIS